MNKREMEYVLSRPVYLIGFMGAGKSCVGRYLHRRYGFEMVDTDKYLEEHENRIIAEIFAEDGEDYFRDLETQYLKELSSAPRIICTGGGVIKRPQNITYMRTHGFVIYLSVTAEAASTRIHDISSRPLFKDLDTARATIANRAPVYSAAADAIVNTVDRSVKQISHEVFRVMKEHNLASHV